MIRKALLLIPALLLSFSILAQEWTVVNNKSSIIVTGTSTMHDWEMKTKDMKGKAKLSGSDISQVQDVQLSLAAKSLKSGKSAMDDKAYDALEAKKHPQISFDMTSMEKTGEDTWKINGRLTIAGETRNIGIPAKVSLADGQLCFNGKTSFKMSSFGVTPPSFMMGTITTGDQITVLFNIYFQNNN